MTAQFVCRLLLALAAAALPPALSHVHAQTESVAPTINDPRKVYWIDPRRSFPASASPALSQIAEYPNRPLNKLREPGVLGAGDEYTFRRVADPLDPRRAAFMHRIKPVYPTWSRGNTWRSEVSAPGQNDGHNVVRGQEYWMAYAFNPQADMMGRGPVASILDVHAADGTRNMGPSPISVLLGGGGITLIRSWNPDFNGSNRRSQNYPLPVEPQRWNYLIFNFKVHWDESQGPFLKVWAASGDGQPARLIDVQGPLGYNETPPQTAQKFGLYRWDPWDGDPNQSRTLYTKGLYLFKAGPGQPPLDEHSMLALLRSI